MQDYLKEILYWWPFDLELVAAVLISLFYGKLSKPEKFIGVIMLVSYVCDITATALSHYKIPSADNQWFYNFSLPLILSMTTVFYYRLLHSDQLKKMVIVLSFVFLIFFILNLFFGEGTHRFNSFTLLPAQAATGLLAFQYMKKYVEEHDENPFHHFIFWFSIANLVNFIGTIPILATLNWFPYSNNAIADPLYDINTYVGYVINFSIIIIGFLWTRRYPASSSL